MKEFANAKGFKHARRAASGLEYGLVVGLIAVLAIAVLMSTGENVASLFSGVSDTMSSSGTGENGGAGGSGSGGSSGSTPDIGGPVAVDDTFNVPTNVPWRMHPVLNDSDPDDDPLEITGFTIDSQAGNITIDISDDKQRLDIQTDTDGLYVITYTISDGDETAQATITATSLDAIIVDNTSWVTNGNFSAGDLTLPEAVASATNGDVIIFDSSISWSSNPLMPTAGFAPTATPLTIDARGLGVIMDGGSLPANDQFIQIVAGRTLNLYGMTMQNSHNVGSGEGGAIRVAGATLNLEDMTFLNNSATRSSGSSSGGAISATSPSTLSIKNSLFESNIANNGASSPGRGGAIATGPGTNGSITLIVEDSIFRDNIADGDQGGAIWSNSSSSITISGSLFDGNESFSQAGALMIRQTATVNISDTIFENNSLTRTDFARGVAISTDNSSNVTLADTTIRNNFANVSGTIEGTGYYKVSGSTLILQSGSTVCGNTNNSVAADAEQIALGGGAMTPAGAEAGNYNAGGIIVDDVCP